MKTKVNKFPQRLAFEKVITLDEIRKKFGIPQDAEITIELPFVDYDNRGGKRTLSEDEQQELVATWERIC